MQTLIMCYVVQFSFVYILIGAEFFYNCCDLALCADVFAGSCL